MKIRIQNASDWEKTCQLTEDVTLVGSSPENAIRLDSPQIAPIQLQFIRHHTGSQAWTLYNFHGEVSLLRGDQTLPLPAQSTIELAPGDIIHLGEYRLTLEPEPDDRQADPPGRSKKQRWGILLLLSLLLALLTGITYFTNASLNPKTSPTITLTPSLSQVKATITPAISEIRFEKFILWIQPDEIDSANPVTIPNRNNPEKTPGVRTVDPQLVFSQKYAELVPDDASEAGYRLIRHIPGTTLRTGQEVLLEWDIQGTTSLRIEPIPGELPTAGRHAFTLKESTNFTLTATNGQKTQSFILPVVLDKIEPSAISAPTPAITFFRASPASVTSGREVRLSWYVTGKPTRIQLYSTASASSRIQPTTLASSSPSAEPGTLLADQLPASGSFPATISADTVFILRVWHENRTFSETVEVKVTRASAATYVTYSPTRTQRPSVVPAATKTNPVLIKTAVEIREIQPNSTSYVKGESLIIYAGIQASQESGRIPAGTILISDGISSCTITLPRSSCELTLAASGQTSLTARYSGDSFHQPATADGPAILISGKQTATIRISGLSPQQSVYTVGDSVDVFVELFAREENSNLPTGKIWVTNGFATCLLTVGSSTHCSLPLTNPDAGRIQAEYSGDTIYATAASEPLTVPIVARPTPAATITATPATTVVPSGLVTLEIRTVLPEAASYTTGQTITVFTAVTVQSAADTAPGGTVLISDGVANCLVQLPRNSCSLTLASEGTPYLTAGYSGDAAYLAAEALPKQLSVLKKKTPSLRITGLSPEKSVYPIDSIVSVYVDFRHENFATQPPEGYIRVSNGPASCMIRAGNDTSCTLPLSNANISDIIAEYPGDPVYAVVTSAPVTVQVIEKTKIDTTAKIISVIPEKQEYGIGDELSVYVTVTPEKNGDDPLSGRISVTDGVSTCTIDTQKENFCKLKLVNDLTSQIEAHYSGDSLYAPSSADPRPIAVSKKEAPSLKITGLSPEQSVYAVGSTVTVYVEFSHRDFAVQPPDGYIRVSNGAASCMIRAGIASDCTLPLLNVNISEITAEFPGDSFYSRATASMPITVQVAEERKIATTTQISGLLPEKQEYRIGDELSVYVTVTPEKNGDEPLSGTIFVTNGYSSCSIDARKDNFCKLILLNDFTSQIEAHYSGDSLYAPSSADPHPITISKKEAPVLKITGLSPERPVYAVGSTVTVYVEFSHRDFAVQPPDGYIRVSNGAASCMIRAGNDTSCTIPLSNENISEIIAAYPGDPAYAAVTSAPVTVQVVENIKIRTTAKIIGVVPEKQKYANEDEITVYVSVTPEEKAEEPLSGTISVTDGISTCAIDTQKENFCALKLVNNLASQIEAHYSGDSLYAPSSAVPHPIRISLVEIGATLQAMTYNGCDSPQPDENHVIRSEREMMPGYPEVDYFTLDPSFRAGGGFYVNATLTTKSGQFSSDPGTVSAKLCHKQHPDYCLTTGPVSAIRDSGANRLAKATLEFPLIQRAGNFQLAVEYSGDSVAIPGEISDFEVRGVSKALLILTPTGVFEPADETYSAYKWHIPSASDAEIDMSFDAYYLKGGIPACPTPLDANAFETPRPFDLKVTVDPSVFGANSPDETWRATLEQNGVPAEIISGLQPNLTFWDRSACQWQRSNGAWQMICHNRGITEPSRITYYTDDQDENYTVSQPEIPILVSIEKYPSQLDIGNLRETLQPDQIYWLNFRNDHFDIYATTNCDGITPVRTVSSFLLDANARPIDQVINLTAYVSARAKADNNGRLPLITTPIEIDWGTISNAFTVERFYSGFTETGEIKSFSKPPRIINLDGCQASTDGTRLSITAASGTLSGQDLCDPNDKTKGQLGVESSFCQLRFSSASDRLPVVVRFAGNDVVAGSEVTVPLSVGPNSAGASPQIDSSQLLMIAEQQPVSILPAFLEAETGYPVYTPLVGMPYRLQIKSSLPLDGQVSLSANWPEIFNPGILDPDKSTCLNYLNSDFSQFNIPGSNFAGDTGLFECAIVFSGAVSLPGPQTMHFTLQENQEKAGFRMDPLDWNGIPAAVQKRELTHLLTLSNESGPQCTSFNPDCGLMTAGDIYRLTYQVPAFADAASNKSLAMLSSADEIGPGIVTWPENWANAIRSAQLSGAAGGIENLCTIDANGQTVFEWEPNTGQDSWQTSCVFILTDLESSGAFRLLLENHARFFNFPQATLTLPATLQRREINLTPTLSLRMNPVADSEPTDSLVNGQVGTLYRSNNPTPLTQPQAAGIAEYTLGGTAGGFPAGRSPLTNDRLFVRWDLLDRIAAMGELPDCFVPDGDGSYQIGTLVESGPGQWSAQCAFHIPASIPTETMVGSLEMRIEASAYQKSTSIALSGQPFRIETARGFVTLPQAPAVFQTDTVTLDFDTPSAPLTAYAKALLENSDLFPAAIQWEYQDLLVCETPESPYRRNCSFRFDTLPEWNPGSTFQFSPTTTGLENLLQVEFVSAETNQLQDQYPIGPVSAANLRIRSTLLKDGMELPLPPAETETFNLASGYILKFTAQSSHPDDSERRIDLSTISALIRWPFLAHPAVIGSCSAPSGELILTFFPDASDTEWTAECDFQITRGDFSLAESERDLTVEISAPGFEIEYEPADQPIRMPGKTQRMTSEMTISPIYQTGNPAMQFSSAQIPAETDVSVDILFSGNEAAFDPAMLSISAGSSLLTACVTTGTLTTCQLPVNCTDISGTESGTYPEICGEEHSITAVYAGDAQNSPAEATIAGYQVVRDSIQFLFPPLDGITDRLKYIWQGAEGGQSWQPAAVSAEGWTVGTYLIREIRSNTGWYTPEAIPIYVTVVAGNSSSQPDPSQFFLDIVYQKSANGNLSEQIISLPPRFYNPADGSLEFTLDFADPTILQDGTTVLERFAEMVRIERLILRYAGDPMIAASEISYQPENLAYPLYVVTLAEQNLLLEPDRLLLEGAVSGEMNSTNFDIFCSQPVYSINCYAELPEPSENEPGATGCWGNLSTEFHTVPFVYASPVISPRCYLFGVNHQTGYDQLWLSDSENDGL